MALKSCKALCMSKDDRHYLKHIIDECVYLLSISKELSATDFLKDETLKRASARSLEIIGEATKKLPASFREQHNDFPWKKMAGMRDRLIHDYLGVNYELVWNVVTTKIPELHQMVSVLLSQNE